MSVLSKPYFHNEQAAFEHLEKVLWPNGPTCPHCGNVDKIYVLEGVRSKPRKDGTPGKVRHGLKKCGACRQQFTVKVGTVFEDAHIPLNKMLQAVYLMCASKKGVSAHQLHRTLEVTYKSAWFLAHRIREAMRNGSLRPMGGPGSVMELDETFIGKKKGVKVQGGMMHKHAVLTLVERDGPARSFHIDHANKANILPIVLANVRRETNVMTDDAGHYRLLHEHFVAHGIIRHEQGEYGRGSTHTNTVEDFYSIFKRGMKGIYQHCSEKHLHRYLAEFDFRYSHRKAMGVEDDQRTGKTLAGIIGKQPTYRRTDA